MKDSTNKILLKIIKASEDIKSLSDVTNKRDLERTLWTIQVLSSSLHSCILRLITRFPDDTKAFFRKRTEVPIPYSTLPEKKHTNEKLIEDIELGKDFPLKTKGIVARDTFGVISEIYELFDMIRSDPEPTDHDLQDYLPNLDGLEQPLSELILTLPPLRKDSTKQWAYVMTEVLMLYEEDQSMFEDDAQIIFEKSYSIRKNQSNKARDRYVKKFRDVLVDKKHETDPDFDPTGSKLYLAQTATTELFKKYITGKFKREGACIYIKNCLENWVK